MTPPTEHRRLAAIMFTDMVGYSALAQRNEALALELLEEHRRIVRGLLSAHGGREVKTTGDGFLIEFPSALAAVQAAVAIQNALHERNEVPRLDRHVRIRIGIHVGDVVVSEGDIHGDGVNIAARIEPLAPPGGICVSNAVFEQVRNKLEHPIAALGPAELKNIELPVVVHRVVMPWEKDMASSVERGASERTPRRRYRLIWAVAGLAVLAAALWWFVYQPGKGAKQVGRSSATLGKITALAVRPFDDFSGSTNDAYLSDGMTEALTAALGNISALRVPGRSSVMQFKGTTKTIQQMARELNVDAIVEGSLQRVGNRLRITAQLIEADTDRHLWATNYDRDLADFFTVQSEVARAIAAEVRARLTPEDQARLAHARPVNRDAVEAYLLGMHHWWHWRVEESTNALHYFQRAIGLDPSYAPAYAGVAVAYLNTIRVDAEALPNARVAAQRAIELDPQLADGFVARGYLRLRDWDWAGAESDFKHAVELSPKSSLVLDGYNTFLRARGRFPEAIAVSEAALQNDPLSPGLHAGLGYTLMLAHRFEEAIARYKEALDLDANFGTALTGVGVCYLWTGQTNEAQAVILKQIALSPTQPQVRWQLAHLYAATGRRAEALKLLAEIRAATAGRFPSPWMSALVHLALGEKDAALDALEKAYGQHDPIVVSLKVHPFWDGLRDQPRFQALVQKVEAGGKEN